MCSCYDVFRINSIPVAFLNLIHVGDETGTAKLCSYNSLSLSLSFSWKIYLLVLPVPHYDMVMNNTMVIVIPGCNNSWYVCEYRFGSRLQAASSCYSTASKSFSRTFTTKLCYKFSDDILLTHAVNRKQSSCWHWVCFPEGRGCREQHAR